MTHFKLAARMRPALVALSLVSTVAIPCAAFAQEEPPADLTITGGATLVSQYRFRGISLSDEEAAIQGTINLNHVSGFYAGFWASSIDGFGELGGSNVELDLYGGFKKEVTSGVTLDAGLLYYAYPGSSGGDFEFFEPYANISGAIGPATAKLGVAFAPSQDAIANNSNLYVFGDVSAGIPGAPVTLKAHIGYSEGDTPLSPTGEYIDWLVGADFAWRNLTLGVAYVDTDIKDAGAFWSGVGKDIVDSAVVVSLTAGF